MNYDQALPNGNTANVPQDATRAEVREITIETGLATAEEWNTWDPDATPFTEKAMNWMKENAEVPAGLGGAVAGGLIGLPLGPAGVVGGSIIGGSVGSGGGSLLSDHLAGEDLDYGEAVKEAAISAGIDIATLGAGKLIKPFAAWVKSKKASGMSVQEAADAYIAEAKAGQGAAGSEESLAASQQILTAGGATLTPYQTGQASGWQIFGEKLADMGMLSSKKMKDNAEKVSVVVNDSFSDIVARAGSDAGISEEEIGSAIHGTVLAGKDALSKKYGDGLSVITGKMAGRQAPIAPIRNALEAFVKKHDDPLKSTLNPDARKLIDEFLAPLADVNVSSAKSVINFEKTFKERLRALSDPQSPQFNDSAARQLADLSSSLRGSVEQALRAVDKPAADAYLLLNKEYATGLNTLLPIINKNAMITGNKESFAALGKMIVGEGSLDATKAMFKSIDEAFKQIGSGTIHFTGADQVKSVMRNAYLKKLMKDIGTEGFDSGNYKALAAKFLDPTKQGKLAFIMGDQYKPVKQLMNTMAEASTKPKSNIGELALRAREFSAAIAIGAGTFVSGGAVAESLAMGAMVFAVPSFLSFAATNAKHVNKIMAFQKRNFKGSSTGMMLAATNVIADVMADATEEQRAAIMLDYNSIIDGANEFAFGTAE